MLGKIVSSLLRAPVPAGLEVAIYIADNNSTDDTERVVREMQSEASIACHYVKETQQGSSQARNAGVRAGSGDLIGFVDDDEQIDSGWYQVVAREFSDPGTEFITGACVPEWEAPAPAWLPRLSYAAIGVTGDLPRMEFGEGSPAELWAGNFVIRRAAFERVGGFSTQCGRGATGLLMSEDKELETRLVREGICGLYVPELIIYHLIPPERLTRRYHRRWRFWNGVSAGVLDRSSRQPVRYFLGIPRYIFGKALRGVAMLPRDRFLARDAQQAFADEIPFWYLLGFIYGRHFLNVESYFSKR